MTDISAAVIPQNLRDRSMNYVLAHFDEVSRTAGFEEMGRLKVDLGDSTSAIILNRIYSVFIFIFCPVFEILRKR